MLQAMQSAGYIERHIIKPVSATEETMSCLAEKARSYRSKYKSRKTCSLKDQEMENCLLFFMLPCFLTSECAGSLQKTRHGSSKRF